MSYKRCIICKKKAVWQPNEKDIFFCRRHEERWGDYIDGKLPDNPRWKTIWKELMKLFLKKEKKNYERSKISK